MAQPQQQQPRPGASPSRTVAIAVGDKHGEDTKLMWRYAFAHILEREHDKVVIVHVRTESPLGWVPISVGQSVAGDAASWLPEEMRFGLKSFEHSEFWELKATSVADGLHDFCAHRCNADLLLIGSRGVTGVRRVLTGSISSAVIDAVDVPCLVVRSTAFVQDAPPFKLPTKAGQELTEPLAHPSRSRQVAFALDGSDISSVLVTWAVRNFLRRDDYVTLLHSTYGLDEFDTLRAVAKVASCVADIQKLVGTSQEAKDRVKTVRLEEHIEPREALLQAVDKHGPFDVMVLGSRGGGTMARLRERLTGHGSVSTHLINYASCPVLVLSKKSLIEWLDKLVLTPETPVKGGGGQGTAAAAEAK